MTTAQPSEVEPEEFVHTSGMDCPCGPTQWPVGIEHYGQLDRVDVLVSDDTE